ncbi:MAG: hypothetical protein WBE65_12470 [Steroidobacteraceae bacterium]
MNEIQLMRRQLATESDHVGAVARACAAVLAEAELQGAARAPALTAFHAAAVEYLARVLAGFEQRDERLRELYVQRPADDPGRRSVEQMLAGGGSSREALEQLGQVHWQEFSRFIAGPWKARRDVIERILSGNPRTADWRAVAGIDADSILEERRGYAQLRQHLPQGAPATAAL